MSTKYTEVAPWDFFQAAYKSLGTKAFQKIFNCGYQAIRHWCRNPRYTELTRNNPAENMRKLLARLCEEGEQDLALLGLNCMGRGIPGVRIEIQRTDGNRSIEIAWLDVITSHGAALAAARSGAEPAEMAKLIEEAVTGLRFFQDCYCRTFQEQGGKIRFSAGLHMPGSDPVADEVLKPEGGKGWLARLTRRFTR